MRQDQKELLDEIGLVWNARGPTTGHEKRWHQQYKKLVEFKRKNGHCIVTSNNEQDKDFRQWVAKQRHSHNHNIMRLDRKDLLDALRFVWRALTLHHKMDRHKTGPGLCLFGPRSVSVTQFGCAVCVSPDCVNRTQHARELCFPVSHHHLGGQMTALSPVDQFYLMHFPHQTSLNSTEVLRSS